jgi:hypothetical protein
MMVFLETDPGITNPELVVNPFANAADYPPTFKDHHNSIGVGQSIVICDSPI